MDIFNLNLPPEDSNKDKFPKLGSWFDAMNGQFQKLEDSRNESEINNLLIDNDIDLIK